MLLVEISRKKSFPQQALEQTLIELVSQVKSKGHSVELSEGHWVILSNLTELYFQKVSKSPSSQMKESISNLIKMGFEHSSDSIQKLFFLAKEKGCLLNYSQTSESWITQICSKAIRENNFKTALSVIDFLFKSSQDNAAIQLLLEFPLEEKNPEYILLVLKACGQTLPAPEFPKLMHRLIDYLNSGPADQKL